MRNKSVRVQVELPKLEPTCFVLMPFDPAFQVMYDRIIKPSVEETGLTCVRADEVFSKAQITHEIWDQIRAARLVLAELTGKNPNVLYELGLAHALGKPSLVLTRNQNDVPFDLRALRYLYYDTTDPFWGENLKAQIVRMVNAAIATPAYGAIFAGISVSGEVAVSVRRAKKAEPRPEVDIAGNWHGEFGYEAGVTDHVWNISLQQSGDHLVGTLIVSATYHDELTVVEEALTGKISDQKIQLRANSYTFLQSGALSVWYLDNFEGVLSLDGQTIEGISGDTAGMSAGLTIRRFRSASAVTATVKKKKSPNK